MLSDRMPPTREGSNGYGWQSQFSVVAGPGFEPTPLFEAVCEIGLSRFPLECGNNL
jgi:hypothetical protein